MAMVTGGAGSGKIPTALSEINVTPLVDVMLVLLIIFMITASMETVRAEQDKQLLEEEQLRRLEELSKHEESTDQQVPINLPKVNSEQVNLTEEKKLVLTIDKALVFYLGDTPIIDCHEVAPTLAEEMKALRAAAPATDAAAIPAGFRTCMKAVEDKLVENKKLQSDGELYLRADRSLDYGMVLMVMARIRKAGVTKFGLVAEPDLEE
jgi:biopolymer transport protein TolR